jgi:NitT/TauT family transport system ATP-binding protein
VSDAMPAVGAVRLEAVAKRFSSDGREVAALAGFDLDVPAGSFTALVGPSGCGKTTLIDLIAGYETPDAGRILFDGVPVVGPGVDRLVVFQETRLFPWMTVLDNVTFGPLARGEDARAARELGRSLLRSFGLDGVALRYPRQLSGGMQRRAELARALINSPKIMLLDEPFRGLDAMTRHLMQNYVLDLFARSPRTYVFVTSELEEAIYLADRVVLLTGRPARVRTIIEVDLGRPRTPAITTSPRFLEIVRQALEITHEEGRRAFVGR